MGFVRWVVSAQSVVTRQITGDFAALTLVKLSISRHDILAAGVRRV